MLGMLVGRPSFVIRRLSPALCVYLDSPNSANSLSFTSAALVSMKDYIYLNDIPAGVLQ